MKLAVFGAGGFVGRALVERLKRDSHEVHAFGSQTGEIDPASGEIARGFALPSGLETIVYLSQSPYYRQVPEHASHVVTVNALNAVKVAELARKGGVRRLVYFSTGSVYQPSFNTLHENAPLSTDSWYSYSKVFAEKGLSLFRQALGVTVVRPFGIYGPGQKGMLIPSLISAVKEGREIYLDPSPEDPKDQDGLKTSLCYLDDAVEVTTRLLASGPEVVNLAGEDAVSVRQIARELGRIFGKEPVFRATTHPRRGDLVASRTVLKEIYPGPYVSLSAGLRRAAGR